MSQNQITCKACRDLNYTMVCQTICDGIDLAQGASANAPGNGRVGPVIALV